MTRLRLRQLVIAAESLKTAEQLQTVLDLGEPFHDRNVAEFGLENAVFPLGHHFIEVVAPVTKDAPVQRFLKQHGPGGYMAIFQTDDIAAARKRLDGAGIRRVWNIDLDDIAASHVHPADVGAAIVSLDEAHPWESWRWAGPVWETNSIEGEITGAILEGPDPNGLASRWAAALGVPASTHPDVTRINLDDDQTLVFQDGAKPRLDGFCLTINNAMKALERADKLDLQSTGDGVRIGGARLVLNNE
ncbi:VOC family protein [Henriciella aquimarina]|uniref:VOC family protein n=1 Tax=Henriciella aquimarina TaxID=545261 RepID=UPI000A058ADA|nr:VOC family protein [Henriciella aquimarina]